MPAFAMAKLFVDQLKAILGKLDSAEASSASSFLVLYRASTSFKEYSATGSVPYALITKFVPMNKLLAKYGSDVIKLMQP